MYSVNYWCSFPRTADDCTTGIDLETYSEALKMFYNTPPSWCRNSIAYIELVDAVGHVKNIRRNPDYIPPRQDDYAEICASEWRGIQAMTLGYTEY